MCVCMYIYIYTKTLKTNNNDNTSDTYLSLSICMYTYVYVIILNLWYVFIMFRSFVVPVVYLHVYKYTLCIVCCQYFSLFRRLFCFDVPVVSSLCSCYVCKYACVLYMYISLSLYIYIYI